MPDGGRRDRCAAGRLQRDAARAHAALVDRREAFGDRRGRGKLVSERGRERRAFASARGRGGAGSSPPALRPWPQRHGCSASAPWSSRHFRRRQERRRQRSARGCRTLAANSSAFCSSAANCCRRSTRSCRLPISSARAASRRLLQPLALAQLAGKRRGAGADHGQGRIQQDPDFHQFVGAASVGDAPAAAGGCAITARPARSGRYGLCSPASSWRCTAT